MPAESSRFRHRLRARDHWFLSGAVALTAVGILIGVLFGVGGSSDPPEGCVTTVRASIMGGATFQYCGQRAITFCRHAATNGAGMSAECRQILQS